MKFHLLLLLVNALFQISGVDILLKNYLLKG